MLSAILSAAALGATAVADDPLTRATKLVSQMTTAEKLQFIQGAGHSLSDNSTYTGVIVGLPRLGIPDIRMNDGPQGFRGMPGTSTQWPSGLTVAHSWDTLLFKEWGIAMGTEFAGKGANVQFGPGVNLARLPNGGRSFEYLSGEDPFLGYTLVQPTVSGIQSQGVIANAKHYINNNQEGADGGSVGSRHSTSEELDERTEMEMYFPPFEGAIKAGVLSMMCGNQLVNGAYVCENNETTNTILRGYGGFKGWVCSDYDGTRSTIDAANHGLDMAMPGPPHRPDYFGAPLQAAMKTGYVSEQVLDEKVVRIVYSLAVVGALDTPNTNSSYTDVTSDAHRALARKLAAESSVLLQNKGGLLPLDINKLKGKKGGVAVIGLAGRDLPIFGGGGSGAVTPKTPVNIFDALAAKLGGGGGGDVVANSNGNGNGSNSNNCSVVDVDTDYFVTNGNGKPDKNGSARVVAVPDTVAGCCKACEVNNWKKFTFAAPTRTSSGDSSTSPSGLSGCWCHVDAVTKKSKQGFMSGTCSGGAVSEYVSYANGNVVADAVAAAKASEVTIVVLAQTSKENEDRDNITLAQSELVAAVAAVQPNVVVVTITPGPFLSQFRHHAAAVVDMGFPGEQEGNALVDILFGDVNPAGKMPHTLPNIVNEMQMTQRQYPGIPPANVNASCQDVPTPMLPSGLNPAGGTGFAPCEPTRAYYDEKLLVGYRWYDANNVAPAFPFGHGLSYTTFDYTDLKVSKTGATVTVTNNGTVAGAEVVQLYLNFPSSAGEPPNQLKAFTKIGPLAAGASTTVQLPLDDRSFSIWSVDAHAWTVVHGSFGVAVGSSSRDIRLGGQITY